MLSGLASIRVQPKPSGATLGRCWPIAESISSASLRRVRVFCAAHCLCRSCSVTKSAVAGGVKPYGARLLINLLKMIGVREILPGCLLVSNVHLASLAQAYVYQCDSACAKGPENALCSGFAGNIRPRPMWRWRPRYSGPSSGRRKRMRACQQ